MESLVRIKELEEQIMLLESQNNLLRKNVSRENTQDSPLFKDLFLNMRNACVIYTVVDGGKDFLIGDVNPSFERIEGIAKKDIIGKNVSKALSEMGSEFIEALYRVYQTGKQENYIFQRLGNENTMLWRDNDIFKLTSGEVVSVYDDISYLKEKELELKNSEAKFRTYFEDHRAIKLQIDVETKKIADVNKAAVAFYGYSKEELLEKTIFDLTALPKEEVLLLFKQTKIEGNSSFSFPHRLKNGDLRDVKVYTTQMVVDGREYFFSIMHDVTEAEKVEDLLRKSEARFRAYFENNTAAMLQVNPQSKKIIEANEAAIKFYGYSSEQFKKLTAYDINMLASDEIDQTMNEVMDSPAQKYIFNHRLSSGESREVEVFVSPIRTDMESQLFVTIYDVSEREANKRVLEENEKKLIEAQKIAKIGSWEFYFDSETMKWSDELYDIFEIPTTYQYSIENYNRLIHPEDLPKVEKLWETSVLEKKEYFSIHRIVTPSNKLKYVEENGYTLYDKEGKPLRSLGTTQDITERKLVEVELEKNRKYLKEAQRIAKVGHFEYHLLSQNLIWSDEVYRIFGFEKGVIPNYEMYRKQIHVDDIDVQDAVFKQALKENRGYSIVYRILSAEGELKYIEEKGYFELDAEQNPLRVIGTMQDITSNFLIKKDLEESTTKLALINKTLEEKVKEEVDKSRDKDHLLIQHSRHAVLGEMIGNIAHQWRQPLNEVSLLVNDLEDAYAFGVLNKEYFNKTMEIVYRRLKYMSNTINDFSKMHSDDFKKEIFSPKELIEKLIIFSEGGIKKNNIQIRFMCNSNFEVFGYPNMLSHILLNLLSNSSDILVERKIKKPEIWLKLEKNQDSYCVRVLDNGKGIDSTVIDKIFDPYFTTKDVKKGSGLGLYMAKSMVEKQMQGQIQVENQRDGAEFKITLDLKKENK